MHVQVISGIQRLWRELMGSAGSSLRIFPKRARHLATAADVDVSEWRPAVDAIPAAASFDASLSIEWEHSPPHSPQALLGMEASVLEAAGSSAIAVEPPDTFEPPPHPTKAARRGGAGDPAWHQVVDEHRTPLRGVAGAQNRRPLLGGDAVAPRMERAITSGAGVAKPRRWSDDVLQRHRRLQLLAGPLGSRSDGRYEFAAPAGLMKPPPLPPPDVPRTEPFRRRRPRRPPPPDADALVDRLLQTLDASRAGDDASPADRRQLVRAVRDIADALHDATADPSPVHASFPQQLAAADLVPLLAIVIVSEGGLLVNDSDGYTAAVHAAAALADMALDAELESEVGSSTTVEAIGEVLASHTFYHFATKRDPLLHLLLRECCRLLRNVLGNCAVAAMAEFAERGGGGGGGGNSIETPSLATTLGAVCALPDAPMDTAVEAAAALRNWCDAFRHTASAVGGPACAVCAAQSPDSLRSSILLATRNGGAVLNLAERALDQLLTLAANDAPYTPETDIGVQALLQSLGVLERLASSSMRVTLIIDEGQLLPLLLRLLTAPWTPSLHNRPAVEAQEAAAAVHDTQRCCLQLLARIAQSDVGRRAILSCPPLPAPDASTPMVTVSEVHITRTLLRWVTQAATVDTPEALTAADIAASVLARLCEEPLGRAVLHSVPGGVAALCGQVAALSLDLFAEADEPPTTPMRPPTTPVEESWTAAETLAAGESGASRALLRHCLRALAHLAQQPAYRPAVTDAFAAYGGGAAVIRAGARIHRDPGARAHAALLWSRLQPTNVEAHTAATSRYRVPSPHCADPRLARELEALDRAVGHVARCHSAVKIAASLRRARRQLKRDLLSQSTVSVANLSDLSSEGDCRE